MLQCLDNIGQKSHQQQIYGYHVKNKNQPNRLNKKNQTIFFIQTFKNIFVKSRIKNWSAASMSFFTLTLFNGTSTFVGYLMPKPFSKKNSSGTI